MSSEKIEVVISGVGNNIHRKYFENASRNDVSFDPHLRFLLETSFEVFIDAGINPSELREKKIGVFIASSIEENQSFQLDEQSSYFNVIKNTFKLQEPRSFDLAVINEMQILKWAAEEIRIGEVDGALIGVVSTVSEEDRIVLFYLQANDVAKRKYAKILHSDVLINLSDIRRDEIMIFLKKFYERVRVEPSDIEFIESYSLKNEENIHLTIKDIFADDTPNYLNSNETFCFETIFNILTSQERNRRLTSVSSFGKTSHGHILLKVNTESKSQISTELPILSCVSSSFEDGIKKIIQKLKTENDPDHLLLINQIFRKTIPLHKFRGYVLKGSDIVTNFKPSDRKKPVWFVYSGLNNQWPTMGVSLMKIPVIKETLEKCHKILEPVGLDLINIITTNDESIFNSIVNSFVGNAAIQIALTDMLRLIGINPDGIMGHSELGCAYADGCITAEQMLMCSYIRGKVCLEANLKPGLMASIGLHYERVKTMLPAIIEIACHNGPNNCTISGPEDAVREFVENIKSSGTFAKSINTNNIPYHTSYINPIVPKLTRLLKNIIPTPLPRSSKWLSTTIDESRNSDLARTSSAEYHVNNLTSPILFEETVERIPGDAILVEIAPHGLLQPVLKRFGNKSFVSLSLTKRRSSGIDYLFKSLAELFVHGIDMDVSALYPKLKFPLSKDAPGLDKLVLWNHEENWDI